MQSSQAKKLLVSSTDSVSRVVRERVQVGSQIDGSHVQKHLESVTKPKSVAGGMKKLGIALIAAPDPITGVGGVALVASALVLKSREPIGLTHLARETKKVLREMQSLRI